MVFLVIDKYLLIAGLKTKLRHRTFKYIIKSELHSYLENDLP